LDSDMRFFTTHWFREKINEWEKERKEQVQSVVLDGSDINSIDSTSGHLLFEMLDEKIQEKRRYTSSLQHQRNSHEKFTIVRICGRDRLGTILSFIA